MHPGHISCIQDFSQWHVEITCSIGFCVSVHMHTYIYSTMWL